MIGIFVLEEVRLVTKKGMYCNLIIPKRHKLSILGSVVIIDSHVNKRIV